MRRSLMHRLALLSLSGVALAACADNTVTGIRAPQAGRGNLVMASIRTLTVCAKGPAGAYNYSLSANQNGSLTALNYLAGNPTFSLAQDECKNVAWLTPGTFPGFPAGDPETEFTLTQTGAPANTFIKKIVTTELDYNNDSPACPAAEFAICGLDQQSIANPTLVSINYYHGSVVSFWNELEPTTTEGCTNTQGYWKTHPENWPAGYAPGDAFFTSGKTWMQVLNTQPSGADKRYMQLAHQYIAATLSMANGASVPADVQAAYGAATAYFNDPATVTLVTSWATTLDAYNNGLAVGGPAHCD